MLPLIHLSCSSWTFPSEGAKAEQIINVCFPNPWKPPTLLFEFISHGDEEGLLGFLKFSSTSFAKIFHWQSISRSYTQLQLQTPFNHEAIFSHLEKGWKRFLFKTSKKLVKKCFELFFFNFTWFLRFFYIFHLIRFKKKFLQNVNPTWRGRQNFSRGKNEPQNVQP